LSQRSGGDDQISSLCYSAALYHLPYWADRVDYSGAGRIDHESTEWLSRPLPFGSSDNAKMKGCLGGKPVTAYHIVPFQLSPRRHSL